MAAEWLLCFLIVSAGLQVISSFTDPDDSAALQSLKDQWKNTPPSWGKSNDPCGAPWEGVSCNKSRVTALGLSTMGLSGQLGGDIGGLTELISLDLSYNKGLTGSLSPRLGDLQKLNTLILAGCGFSGNIPIELGNLADLSFLALNSNNFTGGIPPSLGKLSKLYWLDLAENQLTGSLPISTITTPGLDQLKSAKHFHFNKNQLSGTIPAQLFSSDMVLIHILFDGNQLRGEIPSTIGFVQTLEVLRLDRNSLTSNVPSNLNNLTNVIELNLAHNNLNGALPDLTGMSSLKYVDLSNNSFNESEAPAWFSTLQSLTTLVMEYGSLRGPLPQNLFSFPQIQQVKLRNNAINDTLNMGSSISQELQLVDLQINQISGVTLGSGYKNTLMLIGNPVCSTALSDTEYCRRQQQTSKPYSTSLANCGRKLCVSDQKLSPQRCDCAYPYEGILFFRGPSFRELSDVNKFHSLEMSLWVTLGLTPGSVSLQNPFFNTDDYLQVELELFPSNGKYFNRSEIQRIGFSLSNQTYKPPPEFGPYYFIASPYTFPAGHEGTSISLSVILGIASGSAFLVLVLVGLGIYAVRQKKRAERAIGLSKPFASWAPSGKESGGAPQLKGARWFSYDEIKKCTNNFSEINEIGSGGYGKVYRGMLPSTQVVAVKRAQQGSMQGGLEFKTEIELLSRVHHKNLVGLVGFCFEQGEQMLVYEFMPNGTLRESLSGRSGIHLDWKRRLRIALGSARGLAYLHELADPPIIHRDVKSTNILLDENLTAKVADFGLSKLVSDSEKGHVSTQVKGTLGMKVHATIKQNLIEKYHPLLKEHHVYIMKNFIVAENRMKYKTTSAKYKIIFVGTTRLAEVKDDAFPSFIYTFKSFEELSNVESLKENHLIDVIGKLHAKSFPQNRQIGGRNTRMLDLILEDLQGTTLACTLWGQSVDDLCDHVSNVASDEPIIVILQLCLPKMFRGEIRVSNTYHVSKVIINGPMDEIKDFFNRLISDGKATTHVRKISMTTPGNVVEEFENSKDLLRSIEQILEIEEVGSYWVIGKIAAVETSNDWWYVSCKKCPKKMIPAADKFYCDWCDCFDQTGNIRYKLHVRVVDFSGNTSFLLWDKECNELIGKTALELRNKTENDFPMEIFSVIDKTVLFKVQKKDNQPNVSGASFPVIKIIVDNSLIDKYRDIYQEAQESDIFSKLKYSETGDEIQFHSSEDEVSTPKQPKGESKSLEIVEDPAVKRALMDEFSSTTKEKDLKVAVKIEKE